MKTFIKTIIIALVALVLVFLSFSWRRQDAAVTKQNANSTAEASSVADSGFTEASSVSDSGITEASSDAESSTESSETTSTTRYRRVYRLYNGNTGEHFLTALEAESRNDQQAGWKYEGVAFYAPAEKTDTPVYRLSNPNTGEHFYTANKNELDYLVGIGWKSEGIAWYSGGTTAVYRVSNPSGHAFNHTFVASEQEKNYLVSQGWKDEGVCWYALDASKLVAEDGTPVLEHDKV